MQFLNAVLLLRVMRGFPWFVFAGKCRRPAQRFGRSMKKRINGNGKVAGLSEISVWWLRLGIHIERIKPANPQQNGPHERMHLTLRREATKPASRNLLKQQERFDRFVHMFSDERPHEALGMKYPTELYVSSSRPYKGLSELEYPFHDRTITVTNCGRICLGNRKISLSTVFAGQNVGIKEVADQVWLVSFMQYDLGFFDHETSRITSAENPFGAKVLAPV